MKIKNPSGKELGAFALPILGYVAGAMLSRGVVSAIHTPKAVAGTPEAKKEATMLLVKRGAIVGGSVYGGAAISGTDDTSVIAKAIAYGMAGMQAIDTVRDLSKSNSKLADTTTPTKKFIASSLGLACPETQETSAWGMGRTRRRGMRAIGMGIPFSPELETSYNPLDAIYDQGVAMTM